MTIFLLYLEVEASCNAKERILLNCQKKGRTNSMEYQGSKREWMNNYGDLSEAKRDIKVVQKVPI